MHNGVVADFPLVKRDLVLAVAPELFPEIEGSTDSEVFFHLALTFGLEQDPPAAVARAVGLIEETGRRHGVRFPIQMTVATTDGETTWAFRYSSEGRSRSLFRSTDVAVLKEQYPDHPLLHGPLGRDPAGRLGAAGEPARRLARGAGVQLPGRARRARGASPLQPPDLSMHALAVEPATVAGWMLWALAAVAVLGVVYALVTDDREPTIVLAWLFVILLRAGAGARGLLLRRAGLPSPVRARGPRRAAEAAGCRGVAGADRRLEPVLAAGSGFAGRHHRRAARRPGPADRAGRAAGGAAWSRCRRTTCGSTSRAPTSSGTCSRTSGRPAPTST